MEKKNTRIIYKDEARKAMYHALSDKTIRDLFMAFIDYEYGDEDYINSIEDPIARALFMREKVEIDKNEEKYDEIRKKRSEAGKQGGRPRKNSEQEVTTNIPPMEEEFDIPQDFNPEFSNYVGEEEEQSIDVNGKEEWLASLREDKYPSRREKFDMGWMNYYANRQEAKEEAEAYLAPYKIFIRF